jgi:hypothetical protein
VAFSPQVNYTDWATANCWRILVPNLWMEECRVDSSADNPSNIQPVIKIQKNRLPPEEYIEFYTPQIIGAQSKL